MWICPSLAQRAELGPVGRQMLAQEWEELYFFNVYLFLRERERERERERVRERVSEQGKGRERGRHRI